MIRLEPVTPDNWRERLEVRPDQEKFVAPKATILARAWAYRDARSRAFMIYDGETPVGLVLYHDYGDPEENEYSYDFDQLLIDARYQGRGYGTETVRQILAMMEADGKYDKVTLCYVEGNDDARRLYEKFGFVQTWDEDGEIVMEKRIR
ncbi:MAG: GNAT family N-acetyltransferase [Clostridia bacterium]|nr:GNAT family N-acetyltransferase [Clostridia bacterium]